MCTRPGVLGNPYPMNRDEAQRDPVCDAHASAIDLALAGREPDLVAIGAAHGVAARPLRWDPRAAARRVHELREIARDPRTQGVALRCVCAPANCHCRHIRAWILAPR